MAAITNINQLQPGKVYNIHCTQFDVTNKARFICGDTTGLRRDIGYFQFSDRGYNPVSESQLKEMFTKGQYPYTVFALWQHDLKNNVITAINEQ